MWRISTTGTYGNLTQKAWSGRNPVRQQMYSQVLAMAIQFQLLALVWYVLIRLLFYACVVCTELKLLMTII